SFWHGLRGSEDPRLRTQLIGRIRDVVSPSALLGALHAEPHADVRQAIVLSLGEGAAKTDAEQGKRIAGELLTLFETDPDGGVNCAAEWALREFGCADAVREVVARSKGGPREGRNWFIDGHGHTMLILPAPGRFRAGSPSHEKGRDALEDLREE